MMSTTTSTKAAKVYGAMVPCEERLALCDQHAEPFGHYQACVVCTGLRLSNVVSAIDHLIAGNNDAVYPLSPYDIDGLEYNVLERVRRYVAIVGKRLQDLEQLGSTSSATLEESVTRPIK